MTDSTASSLFTGIGAVPGRAEGRVLRLRLPAPLPTPLAPAGDRDGERARLARALGRADGELQVEARAARRRGALEAAAILDAHRALVTDPVLARELDLAVAAGERAQDAVRRALARWAERLEASSDPTLRSRADDLRDLARRLERLLVAGPPPPPEAGADPCIVVADGLGPSDVVRLDPHRVRGLVLECGGPYGHAVIAARSLGLPTVVAVGPLPDWVEGRHAVLDGDAGWVRVGGADVPLRPVAGGDRGDGRFLSSDPARLADGTAVLLQANIGDVADAHRARDAGACGVGLWRTEWMGAETPPTSEEELTVAFTAVARLFGPEAVTVRLPDPGGGEAVDGASGSGPNPALGRRGVRAALARPESVRPFVRALLRAAAGAPNLRLLVPMVGMAAELRGVRAELAGQAALLAAQGVAVRPLVLGAMLEVPAAVLSVARLAAAADFFSLGTNDLGQYTLAADRGAAATAYLLDGMHPAVLRLVATAVAAAGRARREIGVCGEAAGEPWAIPLLIGVGVRSLSVAPPRVASVRALLARIDPKAAQALARAALRLEDGGAVRRRAEAFLARL